MSKVIIVPIEPIDQRYTRQWYDHIPTLFGDAEVITIDGDQPSTGTTEGAFLDFATTNIYKASQTQKIAEMFNDGKINPGDKFLVTDAWNFAITAIRYMSDLLDIPVEIHGIWHAGAYDSTDILGMKMQKPWPYHVETSWFHACDYNYFGTNFHKELFLESLDIPVEYHHKAIRSGQPHELLIKEVSRHRTANKEDIIVWPHRYNADKQPEIIEDLKKRLDYEVVITQHMNLSKDDYYKLMGKAKIVFSCSLHENLGISMMEGCLLDAIPVMPSRASYWEMYLHIPFLYESHWTSNWTNYIENRDKLVDLINKTMVNYNSYQADILVQRDLLLKKYLNADIMIENILRNMND